MRIGFTAMDVASIGRAARSGFDFIEAKGDLLVDREVRHAATVELAACGVPVETLTSPLPRSLRHKLVGPDADQRSAFKVMMSLIEGLVPLGLKLVVFGCSQARRTPPGFPSQVAESQLADVVARLADGCAAHGVAIGLEPLARSETNMVNCASDALALSRQVAKATVGLTLDYWQALSEGCDVKSEVVIAGSELLHVQSADPVTRALPDPSLAGQLPLLCALRDVGYTGRVSIECASSQDDNERMAALVEAFRLFDAT